MAFCKACGTVYMKKDGCPVCASREAEENHAGENTPGEQDTRMRRRSWIQLLVGVPLFIGVIYLICALTAGLR